VTLSLYKMLLRECRSLAVAAAKSNNKACCILQRPLDPNEYGQSRLFDLPLNHHHREKSSQVNAILKFVAGSICEDRRMPSVTGFAPEVLELAVKSGFRRSSEYFGDDLHLDARKAQGMAIAAIRELQMQMTLWEQTSVNYDETRNIVCMATSSCIGKVTAEKPGQFFGYRIRIENRNDPSTSDTTVQLLGRTWDIYNARKEKVSYIHAPQGGAVGHHPVLHPGECFEYMSGTDLNTMHGTMCGYFNMALVKKGTSYGQVGDSLDAFNLDEEFIFKLPVEPFQLAATNA